MDNTKYIDFLNSNIRTIKGIGEKKAELLAKLNIFSVWDLLYNFPRTSEDRSVFYTISDAPLECNCCIEATICSAIIEKRIKKNISLYILRAEDSTGKLNVKWFSSPFNKRYLKIGSKYAFYGAITADSGVREMFLKEMEPAGLNEQLGRIVPIYPLTSGITQKNMRTFVLNALNQIDKFVETLPQSVVEENNLAELDFALRHIHIPCDSIGLKRAKYRLAFEELFILCLGMRRIRSINELSAGAAVSDVKCVSEFAKKLTFELTPDQKTVVNEIAADLKSGRPMNRLIQGDVGSGKTVVAACGAYIMTKNGFQTAIMAPTEILAVQHYKTFSEFFAGTSVKIGILTASSKNKKDIKDKIANGYYDVVIGTHALIEDSVGFYKLGMCITDEQHRFGVNQRAKLSKDSNSPHMLVMSATPIPRTLSLVLYGDLDISTIKTLPKGRMKTDTFCVNESLRPRINNFIRKQVDEGHQCFVVCPLIEESEKIDVKSADAVYKELKKEFPDLSVAFVHGKMSSEDKDEIMAQFSRNLHQILVSTTVIEVGIDIPNATLMIIENAERFGLSQLHQLRGRVGRGSNKSYCILISDSKTDDSKERMRIMCSTTDGFEIAKQDLELRGCGEFFGTRQHGIAEFKVANLFTDLELGVLARKSCENIIKNDPELKDRAHQALRLRLEKLFADLVNLSMFN